MQQITIFGASGKVGHLVVEEALRRGYRVVAFVHSRDLFVTTNQLGVRKGDIYNPADVEAALRGSSVVLSCLGSWGTPRKNVLTTAMGTIIPLMQRQNLTRIITLTGSGAAAPLQPAGATHRLFMKAMSLTPAGKVFNDGEEHMRLLAASNLAWTTVRSPVMHNIGSSAYRLDIKPAGPAATISRSAVVACMLDQIDAADWLRQAPVIHRQ